jgi:hypothetical protein
MLLIFLSKDNQLVTIYCYMMPWLNYDWAPFYNESSVDVDRLNATVTETIGLAIPSGLMRKNKYPSWFSGKLKFFIRKKNYFYRQFKKSKAEYLYNKFSFYQKLVKATIMSDRLE